MADKKPRIVIVGAGFGGVKLAKLFAKDDVDVMAGALGLRIDQQTLIPLLQQGQAIITCDKDDAASWVKISKPKILL